MERLTQRIRGYAYGVEGISADKLTGSYHRGEFGATACIEKLAEYEDLEEQGKLLRLPCAVGDTVWYISDRIEKQGRKKTTVSFVDKGTVDNITVGCLMVPQISVCNDENIWTTFDSVEDFRKTVFLTREEAEAALKGDYNE